jgi:hypothetical protein
MTPYTVVPSGVQVIAVSQASSRSCWLVGTSCFEFIQQWTEPAQKKQVIRGSGEQTTCRFYQQNLLLSVYITVLE